ncbi:MAG: hypothetical protein WDA53_07775 [Bacillota bacterium]
MKGNDLLNGLGYVDDCLIREAEEPRPKKSSTRFALSVAVGFAVIIAAFLIWSNFPNNLPISLGNKLPPIATSEDPHFSEDYKLYFNNAGSQVVRNINIEGHFWEELTSMQIRRLFPGTAGKYQTSGTVNYSYQSGSVSIFNVEARFDAGGKDIKITIAPGEVIKCYLIEGEPIPSEIEDVKIEAGIFITNRNSKGQRNYIYYADFKIDDVAYSVEYIGKKGDEGFFTSIIADIVLGGKADLSVLANPTVPLLRGDRLTEKEAYAEQDFGAYLPKVPGDYSFNDAVRFINQESNYLLLSWSKGYADIRIIASELKDQDRGRIVSPEDEELYNMALYPTPWADSMPRDTREVIENPIFNIEDLTLDILKMRCYIRGEQDDPDINSVNMRFSTLYGNILVEVSTEGVTPEYLFSELSGIPRV